MTGVLADQGINYDKDILFRPTIENVDFQCNPFPVKYVWIDQDLLKNDNESQSMDSNKPCTDTVIKKFFIEKFTRKIEYLQTHPDQYLKEENIQQPNELSINYAFQIIKKLAELSIYPDKLRPSVEEGICLNFKNKGRVLYFEIYNTGDLGYIIEDFHLHQTIENEDIFTIDDMVNKIKDFIVN